VRNAPSPAARDNDGVVLLPPAVFLAGLVIGYLLWWFWPVGIVPADWALLVRIVGAVATVIGIAIIGYAVATFSRAGTTPTHWEPTTAIVGAGPYAFSRNPMYVGMALAHAGLSLLGNALAPLLLLVPAIWLIRTQVIDREERYLETKFGPTYRDYKRRVRRWL
jgi:protein-S-isoprenylcysteine O-methyltransferase Ste14